MRHRRDNIQRCLSLGTDAPKIYLSPPAWTLIRLVYPKHVQALSRLALIGASIGPRLSSTKRTATEAQTVDGLPAYDGR